MSKLGEAFAVVFFFLAAVGVAFAAVMLFRWAAESGALVIYRNDDVALMRTGCETAGGVLVKNDRGRWVCTQAVRPGGGG